MSLFSIMSHKSASPPWRCDAKVSKWASFLAWSEIYNKYFHADMFAEFP